MIIKFFFFFFNVHEIKKKNARKSKKQKMFSKTFRIHEAENVF